MKKQGTRRTVKWGRRKKVLKKKRLLPINEERNDRDCESYKSLRY